MKIPCNFASFLFVSAWISGAVIANPFWPRMTAIIFPPYSYYVLADRLITTYAPDLIIR